MNHSNSPGGGSRFLVLFGACLVAVLHGVLRQESPVEVFYQSDKMIHVAAFLVLGVTGRLAFPSIYPLSFWLFLVLWAPLLEWLQHLVQPQRSFSYQDMAANFFGVLLAVTIADLWRRGRKKSWQPRP